MSSRHTNRYYQSNQRIGFVTKREMHVLVEWTSWDRKIDYFSNHGGILQPGQAFFFKRGEGDRGNAKKLCPTIARQLAISIRRLKPFLQETIHNNPEIAEKTMREQFEKLILQPLQRLEQSDVPMRTMVIVIDALDEYEEDRDIRLILQLLPQLQNIAAMRLRVLLTSRPDLPIRLGFSRIASDIYRDLVLHDIPMEAIKHDISLFFNYRLAEIRTERFLSIDWPGDRDLQRLVALSVPLFIFAATICRIFEEPDWDPRDSLTEIFMHQNDQSKLDGTYLPVLDRLLNRQYGKQKEKLVSEFQQVIGAIVILESPLLYYECQVMKQYLYGSFTYHFGTFFLIQNRAKNHPLG
ncbi:hypothetical protein N7526_007479 [Penicillium atrosanguineum]|nr:hypothetical protein N7526_007479 [Penicillium atrosanguineum]